MPRIIIIDDEAPARTMLRQMLAKYCPEAQCIGEAESVSKGIAAIQATRPNVIFLDIQMKDGTGFDLLNYFPNPEFGIIFTTAFDHFALKAFDYNAIDYLVKPIGPEGLCRAITRVLANRSQQLYPQQLAHLAETVKTGQAKKILLSTSEGMIYLRIKKLIRLEATGCYTKFFTSKGQKCMVCRTLREFEDLLPPDTFFRIHQSHMVNINYVERVIREDGGYCLLEDGSKVPISRRKKEAFLTLLAGISIG